MPVKEINKNGIKLFEDEKTGEIREPRFEMPIKQAFQNQQVRIIFRTGYCQSVVEIYLLDELHGFACWRADNDNKLEIAKINWIFDRVM